MVELGLNPLVESHRYLKTLKMVSTASLLGARHLGEVVEIKPASLLVVSLGKVLHGKPPLLCERQVARPGEAWAPPGVSAKDSLHDEHNQKQIGHLQRPNAIALGRKQNKQKPAVLPRSDTGSDRVDPASCFVIQTVRPIIPRGA